MLVWHFHLRHDAAICSIKLGGAGTPEIFPIKSGYIKGNGPPPREEGATRFGVGGVEFLSTIFCRLSMSFTSSAKSFLSLTLASERGDAEQGLTISGELGSDVIDSTTLFSETTLSPF